MYSHNEIKRKQSSCDWSTQSQMKSGDENSAVQGHHCMPLVDTSEFLIFSCLYLLCKWSDD